MSLLSCKFSYIWYCLTHFQTNSSWLMLLQQPVKKPRCLQLLMTALTRCINGCMLLKYCWDNSATDEHPIPGAGKSNGASIATETGISCNHLSSIGLYCAFTLITLGFVVTVSAVTITGCHVARLMLHQEHPTSKGHLEFSGAFFLAEIFEKVSFDPYNFRITRLSARKSEQMKNF